MADVKFKRDAETGKEYISLPMPEYSIGRLVLFPSSRTYQAPQFIKYNKNFIRNQFIMGVISGAYFSPDAGDTWRYIVKAQGAEHTVSEKSIIAFGEDAPKEETEA